MRSPLLFVSACLLLTLGLAGCLAADAPTAGPAEGADGAGTADAGDGAPSERTLRGCTEQFGAFTIPARQAEPYLPDGFEPVGVAGVPLADGTVALAVVGLACEDPGTGETVTQWWTEIPVDPPERYAKEGAMFQYVHVFGVVTGAAMLEAYDAWGIARFVEGDVQVDVPIDPLLVGAGGTRAANGTAEARLTTTAAGPAQTFPGGPARLFGVADGQVTGIVDAEFTAFTGAFGPAMLDDDGLLPVTVDGPGAGGNFWGYDITFWPAELPDDGDA